MTNQEKALGEAVSAIYFADDSDYKSALWTIVELLGGSEAVALLESDESAAYHTYAADRNATSNVELSGGAGEVEEGAPLT